MNYFYRIFLVLFLLFPIALNSQNFWEPVNLPLAGLEIRSLAINDNGVLFMGTQDKFYYSSDYGDTWTESTNWPGYTPKCIGFNSSGDIFVGTYSYGMFRSTDGGATFSEINNSLAFLNVWCLLIMDNDDILVGTPGGIFRSTNNGDLWALYGSGLPLDEIDELVVAGNGDIFAGTYQSGVYRSSDNGANWFSSSTGLADSSQVTAMLAIPGELFTALFPEGMYHSTDNGNTWEKYNQGLPFTKKDIFEKGYSVEQMLFITAVVVCMVYNIGFFYLAIISSKDYSWIPLNGGLPANPTTSALAGGGPDEKIFIGTWDQGLFRNTSGIGIEEIGMSGNGYYMSNCSPNPFSNKTSFEFSLPEKCMVNINIFNQSGQLVKTLTNKTYDRGAYKITWTPENLETGLYFYQMNTENFISSEKFVYLGR